MDSSHALSSQPRRKRGPPRARASEGGNTAAAVAPQQAAAWGGAVRTAHPGEQSGPPAFPSQSLDRSSQQHQVADADLLNGYSAPQHNQYPDQSLASASQNDPTGLNLSIAGDPNAPNTHQHPHAHQHHLQQQGQPPQQQQQGQPATQQQQQQQQQRPSAAPTNKTDRVNLFQPYGPAHSGTDAASATVANPAPATPYNLSQVWPAAGSATPSSMPPQSPATRLAPPPEGIYRTFEELLGSVQKVAKDQGYGVVKLRASNYREGKPTRYDLVCDRGGVKYNSTAKKRNPSTRKVDCPWRAKAVCEVNLGNQWRFAVQESRHNHEARVAAAVPGQESTPIAQSIRSIGNKIDRMSHDMTTNFNQLSATFSSRLESIEKRLDALETGRSMLTGNSMPSMGNPNMPTANMSASGMGNGGMPNGGMTGGSIMDNRMNQIEARVNVMERGNGLDSMPMMDDDPSRMGLMVSS
ncbi:hypothetical protein QBC34DRAFT_440311 [Podospora aff. communis PSN243]|uniref:FAR1 domain-containing protein n=1 Tax=Podospora aff. communis PSN243 TaxID=3040156 RepID=A0AAV9GI65_9PEZI|nr:hypothetical protein QBC34DRAFT_440311 [Podospora aff. communis PSN243]